MNQEYPVNTQEPPTKGKPHEIVTTQQRAEQYGKEKLRDILIHFIETDLENTSPYNQFKNLFYHLLQETQSPS